MRYREASLWDKPWGEVRYSWTASQSTTPSYLLPNHTFTGQYSHMDDPSTAWVTEGFGLLFYVSRFYDPYLNQFTQPDSIVPDPYNPQDWNRYAYARYNPLKYTDPSGHNPECGPDGMYCNVHIQRPDKTCVEDCWDAYLTYKALVKQLGYVPTIEEILYMTASAEYLSRTDHRGVRKFGQEGLARNYYEQCDSDGCQGNELYNFLSAYEPWSDWKGVERNQKTPAQRADHLVSALDNNVSWLWDDVSQILDIATAKKLEWTKGKWTGEPWQWFGPFTPGKTCTKNVTPYISIDTGNGTYFWMLFAEEDAKFGSYCP